MQIRWKVARKVNRQVFDEIWANEAIRQCIASGVDHFFLAPGSRCTPLTLAVAKRSDAKVCQHFDERGLAFAALGYGRATGKPGVFICTSGTAVANAYPAVIEAAMEAIPMLLFTADRPPELRGTGANQTIDQREILASYPLHFRNVPVPHGDSEDTQSGRQFVAELIDRSIGISQRGPVHLNWMFREPFSIRDDIPQAEIDSIVTQQATHAEPSATTVEVTGNTLIALGSCTPNDAKAAIEISRQLNCPILSDITSGARTGSMEVPIQFDLPKPDTVLHLGGRIVSKGWLKWTEKLAMTDPLRPNSFVHVTTNGRTINPNRLRQTQHVAPLSSLSIVGNKTTQSFQQAWQQAIGQRDHCVVSCLATASKISEPSIAYYVGANCLPDHALFIGNSTPIRDMDWYSRWDPRVVRHVGANRGASGIDGLIATATGYATGLGCPTTVLLGDLSALHDLNSMALMAKSTTPIILLVINNQAGGIFDLLPVAQQTVHFERFFATPHQLGFEHAAKMFGLDYSLVRDLPQFARKYDDAIRNEKTCVLELLTDRQHNQVVRRQIRDEIARCPSSLSNGQD